MISIIVSSYKPNYFSQFSKNVAETIGVPYEIIKVDNPGLMGICEAYNKGAALAKYELLCFCHEDISIKTNNWGHHLLGLFTKNPDIGVAGFAGSQYKPYVPSGWSYPHFSPMFKMNFIQHKAGEQPVDYKEKDGDNTYAEVATVDGFFMATPKKVYERILFDEKLFKGYHCYDIDYSLAVGKEKKVVVFYNMKVEHFSIGSFSSEWYKDTLLLHKKWMPELPRVRGMLYKNAMATEEIGAFEYLNNNRKNLKLTKMDLINILKDKRVRTIIGRKTAAKIFLKIISA